MYVVQMAPDGHITITSPQPFTVNPPTVSDLQEEEQLELSCTAGEGGGELQVQQKQICVRKGHLQKLSDLFLSLVCSVEDHCKENFQPKKNSSLLVYGRQLGNKKSHH